MFSSVTLQGTDMRVNEMAARRAFSLKPACHAPCRSAKEAMCFSLVSKDQTLNLECIDVSQREHWAKGHVMKNEQMAHTSNSHGCQGKQRSVSAW